MVVNPRSNFQYAISPNWLHILHQSSTEKKLASLGHIIMKRSITWLIWRLLHYIKDDYDFCCNSANILIVAALPVSDAVPFLILHVLHRILSTLSMDPCITALAPHSSTQCMTLSSSSWNCMPHTSQFFTFSFTLLLTTFVSWTLPFLPPALRLSVALLLVFSPVVIRDGTGEITGVDDETSLSVKDEGAAAAMGNGVSVVAGVGWKGMMWHLSVAPFTNMV